VTVYR